jgi:hypothetical protein
MKVRIYRRRRPVVRYVGMTSVRAGMRSGPVKIATRRASVKDVARAARTINGSGDPGSAVLTGRVRFASSEGVAAGETDAAVQHAFEIVAPSWQQSLSAVASEQASAGAPTARPTHMSNNAVS